MATKPYTMSYHWLTRPGEPSDLILKFTALPLIHVTPTMLGSLLLFKRARWVPGSVHTFAPVTPSVWNALPLRDLLPHFPQIFVQMTPDP